MSGATADLRARVEAAIRGQLARVDTPDHLKRSSIVREFEGQSEVGRLAIANAEPAPKASALDRIAAAHGSLCPTDAAKALKIRPMDLFRYLRNHGWIYKRYNGANYRDYQVKADAGLLEHKVIAVDRADGSQKIVEQVLITPRSLALLSQILSSGCTDARGILAGHDVGRPALHGGKMWDSEHG